MFILGFEFFTFEFLSVRSKKNFVAMMQEREKMFYKLNNYFRNIWINYLQETYESDEAECFNNVPIFINN